MKTLTETCTLPLGIEYNGEIHRELELRPQRVGDTIDALENDRARHNDSYLGLCVLARQVVRLGRIPAPDITPDLLMNLYDTDMAAINAALGRLQMRQASFRNADENPPKNDAGIAQAGIHGGGN
jgi:phage FluMu protein gp41